jgi:uncharacterized protein (UPF0261 family)
MLNSVTDVSGINSINRDVYRNAALAVAGMVHGYDPALAAVRSPPIWRANISTNIPSAGSASSPMSRRAMTS